MTIREHIGRGALACGLAAACLLAACDDGPGDRARNFNTRQDALAKQRVSQAQTRLVKPGAASNGGYQSLPADMPKPTAGDAAKPLEKPDSQAISLTQVPAPRIKATAPFPMHETGRAAGIAIQPPARQGPAPIAQASPRRSDLGKEIAAAEARRKQLQAKQGEALRKETEARVAALREKDAQRLKTFKPTRTTEAAPAKGTLATPRRKASQEGGVPKGRTRD